jgi:hypothetical protein
MKEQLKITLSENRIEKFIAFGRIKSFNTSDEIRGNLSHWVYRM